ncbi:MAG: CYTH domain-containing protein [Candidatus Marinimicrobia bacterium]|nr:CYTH domain-containing protein [Candidatus Neomarinimicrobiota bacterium]
MGIEIERKFLVKGYDWRNGASKHMIRQGFLSTDKHRVVRVRQIDQKGFLTVKGLTLQTTRQEYEYEIPLEDAQTMLDHLCEKPLIEKNRFELMASGHLWIIDEFLSENVGLIVAEVELKTENELVELPQWIDREISDDPRYFNSNLVKNPYKDWRE